MIYISASKRAKNSQTNTASDKNKNAILINTIRKRSNLVFTSSSGKNMPNVKPIERLK